MPRRPHLLATDEIYHIYNRTVGHEYIFTTKRELSRILTLTDFYHLPQTLRYSKFKLLPDSQKDNYQVNSKKQTPLVQIYAFAFMPNHYHFLLKQNIDMGISNFISNLQNSFAKFFNIKYKRHGTLFQNSFKAKRVDSNEVFLHLSRYIHLNPVTSYHIEAKDISAYPWTSLPAYFDKGPHDWVDRSLVMANFKSTDSYLKFITDQADYQRKLSSIKHLLFDS